MIEKLYSKIEQNKYSKFLKILIACGSFLFVCIFISIKAHAETVYDNTLPFYFASVNNFNTWLNQSIINSIDAYGLPIYDDDYVLICTDYQAYGIEGSYDIYRGWFYLSPINSFSDTTNYDDWYTHSLNYSLISSKPSYFFGVHYDIHGGFTPIVFNVSEASSPRVSLFGYAPTTVTRFDNSEVIFTAYVPCYFNKDFTDDYNNIVLYFDGSSNSGGVVTGSTVAPSFGAGAGTGGSDFLGTGADFGASISQATMPNAPTYNTYNFTTFNPPSFDDSSILDALKSIADILQYLGSYLTQNITGALNNITSNIQALGQYIGGLIEYVGRSIITNIQNGIQNLFENITSLFEPLLNSINEIIDSINQKLDYISQPFDASAIQDTFENTGLYSDFDSISQFTSTAFGVFDSTSEPSEFKIPLHLENIAILNISQVQYIDLGCINSVKNAIRSVMWCLTTFSLLF